MASLSDVLHELGYESEQQKLAFAKLLHFTGAIKAPVEEKFIGDLVAKIILNENYSATEILSKLKEVTQAGWMRGKGLERWEQEDTPEMLENKEKLLELIAELNLTNEIKPQKNHYDAVLVLGASEPGLENRFDYLARTFEQHGARFDKMFFLSGQRVLDEKQEPTAKELEDKTEMALMLKMHGKIKESWQEELKNIEPIAIDTPMQENKDGSQRRPGTKDTLEKFLEWRKENGETQDVKVLVISSQPYVSYQQEVIQSILADSNVSPDVVGREIKDPKKLRISTAFDTLARNIYAGYDRVNEVLQGKEQEVQSQSL